MKLAGKNILLEIPSIPKSNLKLDRATEEALNEEFISKLNKLTVFAIGNTVNANNEELVLNIGDVVLVHPSLLIKPLIVKIEKKEYFLVSSYDIKLIW